MKWVGEHRIPDRKNCMETDDVNGARHPSGQACTYVSGSTTTGTISLVCCYSFLLHAGHLRPLGPSRKLINLAPLIALVANVRLPHVERLDGLKQALTLYSILDVDGLANSELVFIYFCIG